MRLPLIALAAALTLSACGQQTSTPAPSSETSATETVTATAEEIEAETARLNEWFEVKYEEGIMRSPIQLTFLGRTERQGEIDDFSIETMDANMARTRADLEELRTSFDYNKLTPEAQTSYDIWVYQAEQSIASDAFRMNSYVFDQMQAIHGFFPQLLIAFHRANDEEGMENYIKRISESARGLNQLIDISQMVAEGGVRPPYFAFDSVIEESTKIITGAPFDDTGEDSAVWADAKAKVQTLIDQEKISAERGEELLNEAEAAFLNDFKPAYERLIAWQDEDRVNATPEAQGVTLLPNGVAYYNERLANQTTTDLTADEIHEIGLAEVARLRAEMEEIKADFGFDGTLQEFFVFLRDTKDDPRLYYPDTDEGRQAYIDDATAAIDSLTEKLPDYFGVMPKAGLVVKRV
ncbi:MAG: DUF885 domain-containing protein, partial [Pseudomonadota bacterium]